MRTTPLAFLAFLLAVSGASGLPPARGASFQGLGLPPGGGEAYVVAISADGSTVVGDFDTEKSGEAFRWTAAGGRQELGALKEGDYSIAVSVSDDGAFIYGYCGSEPTFAETPFRWSNTGGMQELVDLSGYFRSTAITNVSSDGSTVVGVGDAHSDPRSFAWHWSEAGGLQNLGPWSPVAVSDDGSVVVGNPSTFGYSDGGFRWTSEGGTQSLGMLPGATICIVKAMSGDGATVVGTCIAGPAFSGAFRWTPAGGMQGLGMARPTAVSRDGSVIVGDDPGGGAIFWNAANGWRSVQQVLVNDYGLDLTGWSLDFATAVSPDGLTIAGKGINPAGQSEAWIARLDAVPEPTSAAMLCAGGVLLVRRRRGTVLQGV